jgi:hypothetical protein
MAVMTIDWRPDLPASVAREYSGYCGLYSFDGPTLTTKVDTAPDKGRIGSEQPRGVRFEGDLMILRPPSRSVGGATEQRKLTWERISPV